MANGPLVVVIVPLCGIKAASILNLLWVGCKSPSGAMASLFHGGPLKCLHIPSKETTALANELVHWTHPLTHFLSAGFLFSPTPFYLPLLLDPSRHRIFIALLVYRHSIDILTQAKYSLVQPACFPICQHPPKRRLSIHTHWRHHCDITGCSEENDHSRTTKTETIHTFYTKQTSVVKLWWLMPRVCVTSPNLKILSSQITLISRNFLCWHMGRAAKQTCKGFPKVATWSLTSPF